MQELFVPTLNFALLVMLLYLLLRKQVPVALKQRREVLAKAIEEAEHAKLAAEKQYKEFSSKLAGFESEANALLESAQSEAKRMREQIVSSATVAAESLLKETEQNLALNFDEFKNQLRRDLVRRALESAEAEIRSRVSSEDHRRILNEYVEKL